MYCHSSMKLPTLRQSSAPAIGRGPRNAKRPWQDATIRAQYTTPSMIERNDRSEKPVRPRTVPTSQTSRQFAHPGAEAAVSARRAGEGLRLSPARDTAGSLAGASGWWMGQRRVLGQIPAALPCRGCRLFPRRLRPRMLEGRARLEPSRVAESVLAPDNPSLATFDFLPENKP